LWAVFSRPVPALAALAVLLAGAQLSIWRWHILLGLQGSPLAFGQVWRVSYISWFLGSFLPGAAGADALRALYVHKLCPGRRGVAFISILIDRLMGLATLLLVCLAILALGPTQQLPRSMLLGVVFLVAGGLAVVVVAPIVALHLNRHLLRLLHRVPRIARLAAALDEAADLARSSWRRQPTLLLACLALGMLGHVLVLTAIAILAAGSGVTALTVPQLALAGSIGVLINQIPLTPGGLGVGELGFAQVCLLMAPGSSASAYGSVMLAFRLVTLVSYLPGGLAMSNYRAAENASSMAATTASTSESSSPG